MNFDPLNWSDIYWDIKAAKAAVKYYKNKLSFYENRLIDDDLTILRHDLSDAEQHLKELLNYEK